MKKEKTKLIIKKNREELSLSLAEWITGYIQQTLQKKNRFTIVLSGGGTPKKLYQLLALPPFRQKIDWKKLHFFWGDERVVPFTDERNNARMAFDTLLSHVPVDKKNIHPIQTEIEPEKSVNAYEKLLHEYFPDHNHTFDLVLLGLGDNAHTLSLFPGYEVVHEKRKWVRTFYLEEQNMQRITLTVPVVNAAGRIVFLISGADKAASVAHVLSAAHDADLYPAQAIQPFNSELYWWLDQAAATDIT